LVDDCVDVGLGHAVVWATDFGNDLFGSMFAWYSRRGLNEVGFHHHRIPLRRSTVVFS
jgi:hypothetical protein